MWSSVDTLCPDWWFEINFCEWIDNKSVTHNRRPDNECGCPLTWRICTNYMHLSNSNRVTIKTRLHLRFSCYLSCDLRGDFAAIWLPFCSDILRLKTLKSTNFSEELVSKRTCVEETLILRPHTYEYFPLIGDPSLLFPFVAFFAVPVFTVLTSMFLFSTERLDVPFWGLHQGSVWMTFPVKIAAKSQLNLSKFETAISRRFLQIAVKPPVVYMSELKSPRDPRLWIAA